MTKLHILVPNDGSTFCRHIYPYLTQFFPPERAELILLRVGDPPEGHTPLPPQPTGYDVTMTAFASERDATLARHPIYASQEWESAAAEVHRELAGDVHLLQEAGYDVHVEVCFGDRGEEIVKFVETHPVDLIAMTTHWRTGLQKLIFGSVAQYVVAHVNKPVFMVRPHSEEEEKDS